jgi:Flp pilus assembly protein TadB
MTSYVLKLGAAAALLLAAGVFGIVIFGNIWARVGIGAALVVVVGGLLLWAWNVDRKDREARAGVDELPRV